MSLFDDFMRVTQKTPCPVCEKPDWCLVARDTPPSRCICKRVESPRRFGQAGWCHDLRLVFRERAGWRRGFTIPFVGTPNARFDVYGRRDGTSSWPQAVASLSKLLQVSVESLVRLGTDGITATELNNVGTKCQSNAWRVPMYDAAEHVIGVRLRAVAGGKFAMTGSRNGIFIPTCRPDALDLLLVSEGESDAAALLDLDFYVIGKPGADNADPIVMSYAAKHRPVRLVVVADNDDIGRSRAMRLAMRLAAEHRDVRVIRPPDGVKDARAWKQGGVNRPSVMAAIDASSPVRLQVTIQQRGA